MGYNSSTKIISGAVNTSDVSSALGVVTHKVNALCTSDRINPFARFKPMQLPSSGTNADSPVGVTDANVGTTNVRFGLNIPRLRFTSNYSTASAFFAQMMESTFKWVYTPRTGYMRLGDFTAKSTANCGYFKEAVPPLVCVVGEDGWAINSISEAADSNARIPFYALFKSGNGTNITQRAVDNSIGMSSSQIYYGDANRDKKLGSSIGAEELLDGTSNSPLFPNVGDCYFGLALFDYTETANPNWATQFRGAYICGAPIGKNVNYPSGTRFDNFCLYLDAAYNYNVTPSSATPVTVPSGKFYAVPFLKATGNPDSYYPLADNSQYAKKFILANGMTDCYNATFRVGTTQGFPAVMPSSGAATIGNVQDAYIYVYISNLTPWVHRSTNGSRTGTQGTIDNWSVDITITGEISAATGGGSVNRRNIQLDSTYRTAVADSYEGGFVIEPGETNAKALAFRIPNIWSIDGVNQAQSIVSGTGTHLMITPTLKYNGNAIGMATDVNEITVYYG
jgi:hypothetical protein